ncbi:20747_t:CDS:1 [Entrophospora sp. SA101]|nr:16113_t:CDS:1 [Entrophospora sp. SA101]CAJ0752373.1 20747_t:CDS:1 [Entrophospora sp. SA101]CAJ0875429.1 9373_t:CDS:1 [Entrophospora sp. SA101]CAJ0912188.1 4612_t:CDS:1 [Entrophospora sp. SA101]
MNKTRLINEIKQMDATIQTYLNTPSNFSRSLIKPKIIKKQDYIHFYRSLEKLLKELKKVILKHSNPRAVRQISKKNDLKKSHIENNDNDDNTITKSDLFYFRAKELRLSYWLRSLKLKMEFKHIKLE